MPETTLNRLLDAARAAGSGVAISTDGPHPPSEQRRWLARQLLDSRLDDAEAFGVVAGHPDITP